MSDLQYNDLLNLPWEYEVNDCFQLARRFYGTNFGIEIPDYAYPLFWENTNPELDLIRSGYQSCGFQPVDVDKRSIRSGDAILMTCGANVRVINHCGIYIENGWFLHQLFRAPSKLDLWAGQWFNATMIVARHPAVPYYDRRPRLSLEEVLKA